MALSLTAYLADAWILGAYALAAARGTVRPFHWANAVGCFPLIAIEISAHAWPVLPLTATFGVLGWIGVWRTR